MPDNLTKAAFHENLNTQFRVQVEPSVVVIVELIELTEGVSTSRQEQFSLTFRGPLETPFGQGTRDVEHDKMGAFVLFLVPIEKKADGMVYEAVFNRLINTDGKE